MPNPRKSIAQKSDADRPARDVRREYFIVKFSQLIADPKDNIRYDYGDLDTLAIVLMSAKEGDVDGPEAPLLGRRVPGTNQYIVSDGFRRFFAMQIVFKKFGIDLECKLMPEPKAWTAKERTLAAFVYNNGKPLEPYEQAMGIKILLSEGMSQNEIHKKTGLTQAYISRLNKLNSAPEEAIALIKEGIVAAATVIDEMTAGKLDKLLKDIREGKYDKPKQSDLFTVPSDGESQTPIGTRVATEGSEPAGTGKAPYQDRIKGLGGKVTRTAINNKKKEAEEPVLSSYKELKKVVSLEDLKVNPAKSAVFAFVAKVINNELDFDQIKMYFTRK